MLLANDEDISSSPWNTKLFANESLMPAQVGVYHEAPEKRLVFAILDDAIDIVRKSTPQMGVKERRLFREAYEWVMANDPRWPFSFVNICHYLGLEPDRIQSYVQRNYGAHYEHSQRTRRPIQESHIAQAA